MLCSSKETGHVQREERYLKTATDRSKAKFWQLEIK